jgi:hypothetical protein
MAAFSKSAGAVDRCREKDTFSVRFLRWKSRFALDRKGRFGAARPHPELHFL